MANRKLIFCLDGTGNEPQDAVQEETKGVLEDDSISNVLKLFLMAGGRLDNSHADPAQLVYYYSGVGTRGTIFRRSLASAFARFAPDWIQEEAYEDLCSIYRTGDEIFIFGFSRGAAIARRLAAQISREGIVSDKDRLEAEISFLGVWDTVASIGKPNLDKDTSPISDVVFENGSIGSAIRTAYHLVALDETRLAFRPILMNTSERVHEIWFPGVHSDVGGGYRLDGLSDLSLKFMLDKSGEHGVRYYGTDEIDYDNLCGDDEVRIEKDDVEIEADIREKLHLHQRSEAVAKRTLAPRQVYVAVDDKPSDLLPIVHHSVIDRVREVAAYTAANLDGIEYQVLHADGRLTR